MTSVRLLDNIRRKFFNVRNLQKIGAVGGESGALSQPASYMYGAAGQGTCRLSRWIRWTGIEAGDWTLLVLSLRPRHSLSQMPHSNIYKSKVLVGPVTGLHRDASYTIKTTIFYPNHIHPFTQQAQHKPPSPAPHIADTQPRLQTERQPPSTPQQSPSADQSTDITKPHKST